MGAKGEKLYGIADKAWHPVIGCDPNRPCAKRCWARKTEARVVECQEGIATKHPGTDKGKNAAARAELVQLVLTPDRQQWSGTVALDAAHVLDPLKWRKSAVVATGFHGDVGLLDRKDLARIVGVMGLCPHLDFMPLTKTPRAVFEFLENHPKTMSEDAASEIAGRPVRFTDCWPLQNVTWGDSVMYQDGEYGASRMRKWMLGISQLGWRTHVWYEPAIGPVDWSGWEFVERIIYGGESGDGARPNDIAWARDTRDFCRRNGRAFVMKQLGADCREGNSSGNCRNLNCTHPDCGYIRLPIKSRKGDDLESIPADLRVRELPGVRAA